MRSNFQSQPFHIEIETREGITIKFKEITWVNQIMKSWCFPFHHLKTLHFVIGIFNRMRGSRSRSGDDSDEDAGPRRRGPQAGD